MKSPGKPSLRRDVERLFWREIAKGLTSEGVRGDRGADRPVGAIGTPGSPEPDLLRPRSATRRALTPTWGFSLTFDHRHEIMHQSIPSPINSGPNQLIVGLVILSVLR
jgi:hypothetical protein